MVGLTLVLDELVVLVVVCSPGKRLVVEDRVFVGVFVGDVETTAGVVLVLEEVDGVL